MKFSSLIQSIRQTHFTLQQETAKAINRNLTIRNWLIGFYIVEFEQNGEDRAKYGSNLINELSDKLSIPGLSSRNLHLFKSFYLVYPHIKEVLTEQLKKHGENAFTILQAPAKLLSYDNQIVNTNGQSQLNLRVPAQKLIAKLSFTHFVELISIEDSLKRTFYEIECMKGNWSTRELQRQIHSLYFERSGLSKNPEKLSALVKEKAEPMQPADIIKSIYAFEFLGLQAKDVIEESRLETTLLDHLQQFMLELGHGFCFEARQKRVLIGDEYFFIDLVFYHRVLKCHVLVDLKIGKFTYGDAGQLTVYLNYYKKEVIAADDNPPVGILLVTDQNHTLVEYATAGMDQHLFVSKYMVELPSKEQLENFIQKEFKNL